MVPTFKDWRTRRRSPAPKCRPALLPVQLPRSLEHPRELPAVGVEREEPAVDPYGYRLDVTKRAVHAPQAQEHALLAVLGDEHAREDEVSQQVGDERAAVALEALDDVPAMSEFSDVNRVRSETTVQVILGVQPLAAFEDAQEQWYSEGGSIIAEQVNDFYYGE